MDNLTQLNELTNMVIKCFFKVYIIVNDIVIVELKAVEILCKQHELQLINYLKATDVEFGLLLNFGKHSRLEEKYFQII